MALIPTSSHLPIVLTISITSWTVCILQIYALYHFTQMQHLIIISKRYPKLIMVEAIVTILLQLIVLPLETNAFLPIINNHSLLSFPHILRPLCTHFIANMEACRLWLIAYNLHFLHASNNEKWKTQIDRNFGDKKNWYLRHKHTYGNAKYIVARGFTYYLCAAFVSVSMGVVIYAMPGSVSKYGHLYPLIDGALFYAPIMVIVYSYWTCRKYHALNDNLMFHYEFKVSTIIFVTGTLILYPLVFIPLFAGEVGLAAIIALSLLMYSLYSPSLISTLWIPHKIVSTDRWSVTNVNDQSLSMMVMTVNGHGKQQREPVTVEELTRNEGQFEALINWMYREFSHENILCFIEMVQFKQYMVDMVNANQTENGNVSEAVQLQCEYTFYRNIPRSSIVYGDTASSKTVKTPTSSSKGQQLPSFVDAASASDSKAVGDVEDGYKCIAGDLYTKYVQIGAEFEVNISAMLRARYQELDYGDWNLSVMDMVSVFDGVIDEVLHFIRQSYVRSQMTA